MGRLATTVLVVVATLLGLVGFVLVSARILERTESEIAQAQFNYVLARADEAVERSLQLGLPLTELEQTVPVLERILLRAPAVEAADVFSNAGITIFSTDRGAVGEPIPEPWRVAIREAHGEAWSAQDSQRLTLSREISNDFGRPAGWAAITIDRNAMTPPLTLFGSALRVGAGAIVLAALVAGLLVGFDRIGLSRRRTDLENAIEEADARLITVPDAFGVLTGRAIARAAETDKLLETARGKMQALDAEV